MASLDWVRRSVGLLSCEDLKQEAFWGGCLPVAWRGLRLVCGVHCAEKCVLTAVKRGGIRKGSRQSKPAHFPEKVPALLWQLGEREDCLSVLQCSQWGNKTWVICRLRVLDGLLCATRSLCLIFGLIVKSQPTFLPMGVVQSISLTCETSSKNDESLCSSVCDYWRPPSSKPRVRLAFRGFARKLIWQLAAIYLDEQRFSPLPLSSSLLVAVFPSASNSDSDSHARLQCPPPNW